MGEAQLAAKMANPMESVFVQELGAPLLDQLLHEHRFHRIGHFRRQLCFTHFPPRRRNQIFSPAL